MTFARIIGFFLLVLTANAIAGQKAQYYVDDTWDGSNEASLSHYHSPQEACVVGVMQRKVHGYQEGASLRFRYRSVFVGTDDGFSEYACQGVIEKQLYIVGANWVTVEAVATNVNGPFDAPESCTPSGTGDGNQCGGSKCNDCCCSGQGTSGASPPPANKPNVGNPIDASTGNKHQVETDFTGSGLFPLHFERTYDSNRTWFNNPVPIGIAWTHSYLGHIDVLPTQGNSTLTEAVVHRPDGSTLRFNLVAGVWTADADVPVRLSVALDASGVAFATLTDTNDTVETYDQLGRLVSITNRDGLTQSLSYTTTSGGSTISHNDVQQVSDPQGRVLTFEYNASGQVANITDGNGSAIQYGYDSGTGNLASVIYPDIGGTTKTRNYLYNEAGQVVGSWPNALTGISEEITTGSFQRFASWGYDNVGRAIFSVHGPYATGTIDKTSLSFNGDGTTTFTDALGQTRTYGFAVSYTVARPSSLDVACDTCASHDKSRGYDSNGYANASTDFNGNKATYHFAALDASGHPRGLETQRVEGIPPTGSTDISAKRTINTQWDPNFRVPAKQDILDSSSTIVQTTKWKYNLRGQPTFRCLIDPKVTGASSYNCGSQANAPSGVRQWAWTYCETGGGCPLVGIVLTSKGPRSDAATTYTYFPTTDLSGCATGGVCHRLGDVQTITAQVNASSTLTTTVATYDGNGRPTRILDSNGVPTDLSYHPRGWLTQRVVRNVNSGTNANDRITTWTYNGAGKVTQVTHPIGDYEIFGYDIAHRLTDVTNKMNEHMHFVLDAAGNRAEEDYYNASNVIKHKVLRDFDVLGRLHDTKNAYVTPASLAMTYSYDSNGNMKTTTDGRGHVTSNIFDPRNRLVQTEQDAGTGGLQVFTEYSYDVLDRLIDVKDPQGLHTQYTFDGLGNLKQLSSPDTGIATYGYDAAGNRTSQVDARSPPATTNYTYDALNRLTGIVYPNTPSLNSTFTWDTPAAGCVSPNQLAKGRLATVLDASGSTTRCYNRFGDITLKTQTIAGAAYPVTYVWSKGSRLNSMTEPNGTLVSYVRDTANRIKTVKYQLSGQPSASTLVSSVTYNPFGPVSKITYGNGRALTDTYDLDYVIKSVVDPSTVGDGLNLTYGRDSVTNLTSVKLSSTVGNTFVYDGLNRLKQVNDLSANPQWRYTYDGTGNRLTEQQGTQTAVSYTYPLDSHHLKAVGSTLRGYDNIGNTTSIGTGAGELDFHYDDTNRMDQLQVSGALAKQYLTNALGQRVMKSKSGDSTQTVHTVFDEQGHRLGDFNASNGTVAEYLWMDNMPVGVVDGATSSVKYIEPDHLGTPRTVIDPVSNVAIWNWPILNDPFGKGLPVNMNGSSFVLNLRFAGQNYDAESGIDYNYFRDYDPTTGRYIESDPMGLKNGSISTYAYVSSNPISWRDAFGLAATCGGDDRCIQVRAKCREQCSESSLPSRDHGFRFFNCLNKCESDNGCGPNARLSPSPAPAPDAPPEPPPTCGTACRIMWAVDGAFLAVLAAIVAATP